MPRVLISGSCFASVFSRPSARVVPRGLVGTGALGRVELMPGADDFEAVTLRCLKRRHGEPVDIALHFERRLQRFTPTDLTPTDGQRSETFGKLATLCNRTPAACDDDGSEA